MIYDIFADRGLHKRVQAEASRDFRLQEASGRDPGEVPSTAELIRGCPCGAKFVQQEPGRDARRGTRSEEEAEDHEPAGRAIEGGHCDEGSQPHQGGIP